VWLGRRCLTYPQQWMFLLVPAHPGCPGQNPKSRKTVECVCVCVVMIHQRHRQTYRQTDRRTHDMRSQDCTLHHSASRGKNVMKFTKLPPEIHRATATSNMHRELGEVWTCGFWDMLMYRHTDPHPQTPRSAQYYAAPYTREAVTSLLCLQTEVWSHFLSPQVQTQPSSVAGDTGWAWLVSQPLILRD